MIILIEHRTVTSEAMETEAELDPDNTGQAKLQKSQQTTYIKHIRVIARNLHFPFMLQG
jgi:hypothetical protein